LSRRHLTHIFRESTGESIGDYQTRQRVARAAKLLSGSGTTVLAASMAVGVKSPPIWPGFLSSMASRFRKGSSLSAQPVLRQVHQRCKSL